MIVDTILAKVVGTQNDRTIKKLRPLIAEINGFEPSIQALSDDQLRAKTAGFRQRFAAGRRSTTCCPRRSPSSARRDAGC